MKHLLFLLPSFQLGGTNSALNNFLSKIDKNKFSIDVYTFDDNGPNREGVSKYATILGADDNGQSKEGSSKLSLKDVVRSVKRFIAKLHIDISPLIFQRVARQLSSRGYDIVIAFQEGQTTKFLTYFKNTFKIAWIHCDYQNHIAINNIQPERTIYSKVDRIVCVSKFTRESFLHALPEMESKTVYLHNALDVGTIIAKSKEPINDVIKKSGEGCFNLVSIGRIDPVKRFYIIPRLAAEMKEQGARFRWFIIGDGPEEHKTILKNQIKKYSVEDVVTCLGTKTNPYPFIAAADLLVMTSVSEACPTVLNEAKILNVPVVTTDYGSAYEFIENEKNGIICAIDNIPHSVLNLMKDFELYNKIKCNLAKFEYPNDAIMCKLEKEILKK